MVRPFATTYRLGSADGDGLYPCLGREGACLGGVPLLEKGARGEWRVRSQADLERLFTIGYGEDWDLMERMAGLAAVAAIRLVHLRLPPLPDAAAGERMAKADALSKRGDNPDEPRIPKGRSGGGQWTASGYAIENGPLSDALEDFLVYGSKEFFEYYVPDRNLPKDAVVVVTPDGAAITDPYSPTGKLMAPPSANFHQVYAAGKAIGPLRGIAALLRILVALGHGGTYDFQRNPGTDVVYPKYADASNYAVGVFLAGAGWPRAKAHGIAEIYAWLFSSNAGSEEQTTWIGRGFDDAYKGKWRK